jgi:hypothetical protein
MSISKSRSRSYDTRLDRCRRRYGIPLPLWAAESGVCSKVIGRYRSGEDDPMVQAVARLVRAARRITGQHISANDMFDLGEDEPLTPRRERLRSHASPGRREYDTRVDHCLRREDVLPIHLAREAGLSRQAVYKKRTGQESFRAKILARTVRAMRRMGRDIRASDLADVGED